MPYGDGRGPVWLLNEKVSERENNGNRAFSGRRCFFGRGRNRRNSFFNQRNFKNRNLCFLNYDEHEFLKRKKDFLEKEIKMLNDRLNQND